ncbi:DUF1906 domain-containing protein [Corynebacterium pilosum]|uniref:Putative secreted protein n=1 Tax=Corynebacterium pilosum TaxID=35756 RepID=A0A376CN35_9CORY|nr:DUF1906 domain-containing protein [Corynebacterium pilosum]STC69936.1 putative secreted protein [Corynebacterium pilosum]
MNNYSRRGFMKAASIAVAAGAVGSATVAATPSASAQRRILGTVVDYSAGVPTGRSVKAAGHMGAVRYVSQARPDAISWMKGKPVSLTETRDFAANGLATASVYQFGRANNADWLQGAAGAATHAPQAINLHQAAGGPTGRPIYIAIDDNPTWQQYTNQIRPYLRAFQAALTAAGYQTGVYGNWNVIEWCVRDGIGTFFWQHDWGSGGKIHPRTTIHQKAQWQAYIDGVQVDINNVYASDWGQWTPGQPSVLPNVPAGGSSISDAVNMSSQIASQVPVDDIQRAIDNARKYLP